MIIIMVVKLTTVNMLFNMEDSFTPMLSKITRSITTPNAKKSGYCDKNGTRMGIADDRVSLITFPINASK